MPIFLLTTKITEIDILHNVFFCPVRAIKTNSKSQKRHIAFYYNYLVFRRSRIYLLRPVVHYNYI